MPSIVIRAALALSPGCTLIYDPPPGGESNAASEFFSANRNKAACFVGYAEQRIGLLDPRGLLPGLYVDPRNILVQFDGEDIPHPQPLNIAHFIVCDTSCATLANSVLGGQRLGDLGFPILFYPGDMVVRAANATELPNREMLVQEVYVNQLFGGTNPPRYALQDGDDTRFANNADLQLVRSGNVRKLYEYGTLSFTSDEAELAFWRQDGVSGRYQTGFSLDQAVAAFASGRVHLIERVESPGLHEKEVTYTVRRLHPCFGDMHRGRIRDLTERWIATETTSTQ